MWQDKNKEHPVFDNDPPTRFCTDYPIIILRSSLSAFGRQEFGLPFCHLICALAFFLFSFSFSCYVLCRYASWKIVVLGTRLKNGRHWRMPWFRRLALPCPAWPVPVPALHRNFVAALKSMQQIYAVRSSLSTSSCLGRITPHRAAASVEHISWNFENLHILRLPQGTQRSAAFCAVVSSLIWLIYAIRKRCAAHIRNISKQIKCCT